MKLYPKREREANPLPFKLKILKRPHDATSRKDVVAEKPIKALADREKDYMEARRKIFEKFENKK